MTTSWDYLEDVRFVLQETPKPKRASRMSIRQFFRPSSGTTQTSERGHRRVSVRYPRGRAPTLHLRLSEFDINPVMRALRSPNRSPNSIHTHLIPETTQTRFTVGESKGYLDAGYPRRRNPPSDVFTSPITPTSPWTVTGQAPGVSPSIGQTARPRSPTRDEPLHHPTHVRGDTMSSTASNLQMEVMTLSGSPPDPGFVLPIPSRSWGRRNLDLLLASTAQPVVCDVYLRAANSSGADLRYSPLQGLGHAEDIPADYGHHQIARATLPANEDGVMFPPLEPPQLREPSWISENSDVSSAVISTVTKLTRANTIASVTSVAIRHTPATVSSDDVRTEQQNTVTNEHLFGNPSLSASVHVGRSGGMV